MNNSVYIHIPFCSNICSYCDFCKVLYNKDLANKYLISLQNEIKDKYKGEVINTLYFGGGTPSALTIDELNNLFDIVSQIKLNNNYEFTVEMNLSDITDEKLSLFKSRGVNRLSIGVQSVNPKFFDFLNRKSYKEEVIEKIKIVKKYFDNFNIDLMYAFPNETLDDVINDLSFIVSLNPPHISIYSLIIEPHTIINYKKIKPIDEELESKMYYNIIEVLKNNNYIHYEISNFSKKGYESLHNLTYWNNERYYGFGPGASGYIDNIRYTNTRNLTKYFNKEYIYEESIITKDIDMENELIFGLRKTKGINKKTFYDKFHISVYNAFDIDSLINKQLLIDNGEYIYIPEDKLYVSNSILINFIGGSK